MTALALDVETIETDPQWQPVPHTRGQRSLFALAAVAPTPQPPAKPRFRRTGENLTITLACDGGTHKVTVAPDGTARYENHEAWQIDMLAALGNEHPFTCMDLMQDVAAARQWLALRTLAEAPRGYWSGRTWETAEVLGCCRSFRPTGQSRSRRERARGPETYGAMLNHSRTVGHVAALHMSPDGRVRRIAQYLADIHRLTLDPKDMPDAYVGAVKALVGPVSWEPIARMYQQSIPRPYIDRVAAALPRQEQMQPEMYGAYHGDDPAARFARHLAETIMTLWRANLDADWIETVAAAAHARFPRIDGWSQNWPEAIAHWNAMTADQAASYLAAGVVDRQVPEYARRGITPAQTAEFHRLRGRDGMPLSYWLDAGYEIDTTLTALRLSPDAAINYRERRGELARRAEAEGIAFWGLANKPVMQRLMVLWAVTGTAARAVRWHKTELPLEAVAEALRDGLAPAAALKRCQRRQP